MPQISTPKNDITDFSDPPKKVIFCCLPKEQNFILITPKITQIFNDPQKMTLIFANPKQ